MTGLGRLLALIICVSAAVGIGLEFTNLRQQGAGVGAAAWSLGLYFTILTNLLVGALFGLIAVGLKLGAKAIGGVVASIVLVGVVYALLLQGVRVLGGATALANLLLHQLNPVLAAAYWLIFVRKGQLAWRDPVIWAIYPLVYLAYALWRGQGGDHYPYPFIDLGALGWTAVALNCLGIAAAFVLGCEALVVLDRALGKVRRSRR